MSAHVESIAQLEAFRAALHIFGQSASETLSGVNIEISRMQNWLEGQMKFWREQIRKAEERVLQARNDLARQRMVAAGNSMVDTSEQEKQFRKAQAQLAWAEEKLEVTRCWLRDFPTTVGEFQRLSKPFQNWLENDLDRAASTLGRKIASLEAYANVSVSPSEG